MSDMTLHDFQRIVFDGASMKLSEQCLNECEHSYNFLAEFSHDRIIYGVNTGFGPMAQHVIPNEDRIQLQYNLVRSHSTGQGALFSERVSRAIILCRLVSLSKGFSAVHPDTLHLLAGFVNHKITPSIYEHGGVGASGDLVQLAHLALNLIGEGHVRYKGEYLPSEEVLKECGLNKMQMYLREGLSLINGTSAMTGLGLVNVIMAKRLLRQAMMMSAMLNEITYAYDDHHSVSLNEAKKHPSQMDIAADMRNILSDSQRLKIRYEAKDLRQNGVQELGEKMQEFYSIRCVPQILGPIKETIDHCEDILLRELNSANDNPIIDYKTQNVYHGGNFHGDYISLEMDKLKIAVTKLTMLCERQINFLMNHKINDILPPFINMGRLGFNFGLQGIQFTATSTTAESQTLSNPMYVHSIPTNNDNQDIVSMGTNAASMTSRVIDNGFQVMGIGLVSACQAIDYLKIKDKISSKTRFCFDKVREVIPLIIDDQPRHNQFDKLTNYLKDSNL